MANDVNNRRRNWGTLGPILLIALGAVFLLDNIGLFSWNIWTFIEATWPVVIIAIGVDILLGGRSRGLILGGAIVAAALLWYGWGTPGISNSGTAQEIEQRLEGARAAEVRLSPGVARLTVEPGDDPGMLIEGNVTSGRGVEIDQDFRLAGNTAIYSLDSRQFGPRSWFSFGNDRRDWELELNRSIPLELWLDSGVGDVRLDLNELQLRRLTANLGVGDVFVTLPEGNYEAFFDSGVGDTTVRIPDGVPARVRVDKGVGDVNIRGEFISSGNLHVSPDFESARERIDITVDSGVGEVTIERY